MKYYDSSITLSVSCVFFDTDESIFQKTLESLAHAITHAKEKKCISYAEVHLINNNPQKCAAFLNTKDRVHPQFEKIITYDDHGNLGYGRANNLAIERTQTKYHLILNPDVELAHDSLTNGIKYLEEHQEVGLVAPDARNQFGETEYLAKRSPSILVIILRGLNNYYLNQIFHQKLDDYMYKDLIPSRSPLEIEIASGCFMLCRATSLKLCNGFSPDFFLYFEDFDLSRRISEHGKIIHLPSMKIMHFGGNAAKKGHLHIYLFLKSAFRYFLNKTPTTS